MGRLAALQGEADSVNRGVGAMSTAGAGGATGSGTGLSGIQSSSPASGVLWATNAAGAGAGGAGVRPCSQCGGHVTQQTTIQNCESNSRLLKNC